MKKQEDLLRRGWRQFLIIEKDSKCIPHLSVRELIISGTLGGDESGFLILVRSREIKCRTFFKFFGYPITLFPDRFIIQKVTCFKFQ